jgi:hypothetical protein
MNSQLPLDLRPLFWSYNFDRLDKERDKKIIITNVLNYGDLKQWRWLAATYGHGEIVKILQQSQNIRSRAKKVAETVFTTPLTHAA